MTEQITVTPAQVVAAKMQVELADQLGEAVSPLVRRIAGATPAVKKSERQAFDVAATGSFAHRTRVQPEKLWADIHSLVSDIADNPPDDPQLAEVVDMLEYLERSVAEVRSKQGSGDVPEFMLEPPDLIMENPPAAPERSARSGRYVTKGKGPKRVPDVPQASQRGRTRLNPAHGESGAL